MIKLLSIKSSRRARVAFVLCALLCGGGVTLKANFFHRLGHSISHTFHKVTHPFNKAVHQATHAVSKVVNKAGQAAIDAAHQAIHTANVAKRAAKDAARKVQIAGQVMTKEAHDAAHLAAHVAHQAANEAHKAALHAGRMAIQAAQTASTGVQAVGQAVQHEAHKALVQAHDATQALGRKTLQVANQAIHQASAVGHAIEHEGEQVGKAVAHAGEVVGEGIVHAGKFMGKGIEKVAEHVYRDLSHPGDLLADMVKLKMDINSALDKMGPLRKILTNPLFDTLVVGMIPGMNLAMPLMQLVLMPLPGGGSEEVPMQPSPEIVKDAQEQSMHFVAGNLCNPFDFKASQARLKRVERLAKQPSAKTLEDDMFKAMSTGLTPQSMINGLVQTTVDENGIERSDADPKALLFFLMVQNGAKPDAVAAVAGYKKRCKAKITGIIRKIKQARKRAPAKT